MNFAIFFARLATSSSWVTKTKVIPKLCKLSNRKVITGIYGEVSANTGGPFISHIIEDKNQNKAFFLTGYVNNPGKSKILMLRELELLFQRSNYLPF